MYIENENLYCIYLRKSRADADAERHGTDTLERHEKTLLALSDTLGLKIGKIYREVVSGDTIAARPEMQQLLSDVENNMWAGVLVMEVERLARGATIDQGIIAQVFKYSNTKIITPLKTYNPNDEYDEEFFEYGLFQSRREYKAITRRQQRGVVASCEEGKWPYNKAPYGYERYKLENQKGWSLRIIPEQSEIVRLIFHMYADEGIGYSTIAERLNEMKAPAPNDVWIYSTVKDILVNPVYIGKVKRGERATVKTTVNGSLSASRPRNHDYKLYDGLHEPIIDEVLFHRVQSMFKTHPSKPVGKALEIQNPLAGLVYCKKCGHKMIRRPQDRCKTMIICPVKSCDNISTYETVFEEVVIDYLKKYLDELKLEEKNHNPDTRTLSILNDNLSISDKELQQLNEQLDNAYDLVEKGVYSPEIFLKRSHAIQSKIDAEKSKNEAILKQIDKETKMLERKNKLIPKIESTLAVYDTASPAERNRMLSDIIERIDYIKTERSKRNGPYDNFTITVTPVIPM